MKEPLEIAAEQIAESGLEDRIGLVEGDFDEVELGSDSDVVLISGVVLIKSESECRRVIRAPTMHWCRGAWSSFKTSCGWISVLSAASWTP